MPEPSEVKPLHWNPVPGIGYSVVRRPDGGMHVTFTDLKQETLAHWREFALEHLLDADRLTRNLYDLRSVESFSPEAAQYALEVLNDPSVRNVRVAVVVANEEVRQGVEEITALSTPPGGVEIEIFTSLEEAESWLDRPLTLLL